MNDTSLTIHRDVPLENVLEDDARRVRAARRRERLEHRALLLAVLAVVMLITLPRLHGIALRENELDALRVLDLLAPEVLAASDPMATPLGAFLDEHSELEERLADVERLDGGRLVRRHGYLFELARLDGRPCLRAWPYEHGRTGLGAFVSIPRGGVAQPAPGVPLVALLAHPNETDDGSAPWDGPWSGPDHAPVPVLAADRRWRRVRVPGSWTESY